MLQFQTEYTCMRPDWPGICARLIACAMPEHPASCALLHFMYCWKDGWCRLEEFWNTCFVNLLQCIFYIPPLGGITSSMAQNYNTMSHIVVASTVQYWSLWKMIDNIGHMFCLLGISDFQLNVCLQLLHSSCTKASTVRQNTVTVKHITYIIDILLNRTTIYCW